MAKEEKPTEKRAVPIVPYLKLPEGPGEEPYLWGMRCRACGSTFVGSRLACPNCTATDSLEEVRFSRRGEIWAATVVWQAPPGVPIPFVAAIVDLPEGASVRATIEGLDASNFDPSWLGMKVEMFTEKVRTDREGNDVIAYKFRPVKG